MKYEYVRQKLNLFGYDNHCLTLASIPLVSSLLDDLIATTEGLKDCRDENIELLKEKKAWDLGNEVYKCDNSKLLQEVNQLKLDLLSKDKNIQIENASE